MYTVYCIHSKFKRSIYFDLITFMRTATILIFWNLPPITHISDGAEASWPNLRWWCVTAMLAVVLMAFFRSASLGHSQHIETCMSRHVFLVEIWYMDRLSTSTVDLSAITVRGFLLCTDRYMSLTPSDRRLAPQMCLSHMVPACILTTPSVEKSEVHCFLPLNIAVCCFDFSGSGARARAGGFHWLTAILQSWDLVVGTCRNCSIINRYHMLGRLDYLFKDDL